MTEETRPGFLANYKIVRPGPARPAQVRPGPQFKNSARARPGPLRPGPVDTSIYGVYTTTVQYITKCRQRLKVQNNLNV